jgi:F-type H+-transporting ATPase subunit b
MTISPLVGVLLAAGKLTDVSLTLFVATVVLFTIFAFVLARFAWGPLLKAIEEREKGIKDSVEGAESANAEAKALLEKHRELLRDAGREREEILKRAVKEAEALRTDLSTKARAESDQIVARAREQIQREKDEAIQELRSQVVDLAMEAATKIVKSSLTPEAQRKLVSDFISSMPRVQ